MQLKIEHLSFAYEGTLEAVFDGLSLSLDTSWRTGLIVRNGRGKTTLLRLLAGALQGQGRIACPLQPVLFPYPVEEPSDLTWNVMAGAAPMAEDWQLRRELNLLHVEEDVLLWDEPLNFIDVFSRVQLEELIVACQPTMLLVEHDARFLKNIGARRVEIHKEI